MFKTYIESHSSSLTAQAGQEQQDKRDEPRARDEDDDVGRWREGRSPGLRNCKDREQRQGSQLMQELQELLCIYRWGRRNSLSQWEGKETLH